MWPDGKLDVGGAPSRCGIAGRSRWTTIDASTNSVVSPATATARNAGSRGPCPRRNSTRQPTAVIASDDPGPAEQGAGAGDGVPERRPVADDVLLEDPARPRCTQLCASTWVTSQPSPRITASTSDEGSRAPARRRRRRSAAAHRRRHQALTGHPAPLPRLCAQRGDGRGSPASAQSRRRLQPTPRSRAMSIRCTSLVPSPISRILASR